jgi:predicted transcriptional regulator
LDLQEAAMPRAAGVVKDDSLTFRLEPALKTALTQAAAAEHKQPGELMRELIREHLAQRRRRAFEDEARRQCLAINAAAHDPKSDEAAVLREIDNELTEDDFAAAWRA